MVLRWRRRGRVGGCQIFYGGVAQLGEYLPCKQGVKSSNLSVSTVDLKKQKFTKKYLTKKLSYVIIIQQVKKLVNKCVP